MSDDQELYTQDDFDKDFITSPEIERRIGVNRSSINYAKRNGLLPAPIIVNNQMIWRRTEIEKHLKAWEIRATARRKNSFANVEDYIK